MDAVRRRAFAQQIFAVLIGRETAGPHHKIEIGLVQGLQHITSSPGRSQLGARLKSIDHLMRITAPHNRSPFE